LHRERVTPSESDARAHATITSVNLDILVNKLRRRFIRTLFIKLQLIFYEWFHVMVNSMPSCRCGAGGAGSVM